MPLVDSESIYLLLTRHVLYCLFGLNTCFFSVFMFYALFGVSLKGMGERFLLSKDEHLTPDIDGVMAL